MDPLRSSDAKDMEKRAVMPLDMPRRKFSVEFLVGLFTMLGVGATGYLAINLGGLELAGNDKYPVYAKFTDISGLKFGASVEMAGVPIGEVSEISLKGGEAEVKMLINKDVSLHDDDQLNIRTKGIIGDRFVKVVPGGSEKKIAPGQSIHDTNGSVDIEDLLGKFVHGMDSSKSDQKKD